MSTQDTKKHNEFNQGASNFSGHLGRSISRLRKTYKLSLQELSEQSGVAKSIISQIERNETNPTLATIWRLSQALDVSIDRFLEGGDNAPFVEKISNEDMPILISKDGLFHLKITGWIKTVEWLQWYDVYSEAQGVLDSEGHQRGSIESLSVISGEMTVEIAGRKETVKAGESLRYHCDQRHIIRNETNAPAHATMVCILKAAVME